MLTLRYLQYNLKAGDTLMVDDLKVIGPQRWVLTVIQRLKSLGVRLVTLREDIDFTTDKGMAFLARLQADHDAHSAKVKQGFKCPRTRKIDDAEVARLVAEGKPFREIGRLLGVSHTAIRQAYQRSKGGKPME